MIGKLKCLLKRSSESIQGNYQPLWKTVGRKLTLYNLWNLRKIFNKQLSVYLLSNIHNNKKKTLDPTFFVTGRKFSTTPFIFQVYF